MTSGIGPDLWEAARVATQEMVEWLARLGGLAPEDAYLLTSVAGDLKISEIVDAPNWVDALSQSGLRGGHGMNGLKRELGI
ncbi:acetamidase/formamidase family protein [Sulfobacillus harzensis]|uniref:acetamidase/formamidase family protein n=1 Tax=Sulfobacillus harzensis TaxID=2729629 RepID=UPI001A9AC32B